MSNFVQRSGTGRLYQNPATVQGSDVDIRATNLPVTVRNDPTYGTYRKYADGTTQGRRIFSTVLRSAAVALTTATVAQILSVSIPANSGWRISGGVGFLDGGATTHSSFLGAVNTSVAVPSNDRTMSPLDGVIRVQIQSSGANLATTSSDYVLAIPAYEYNNTTNAAVTLYLVVAADFAVSTCSGFGFIEAISIW